MYKDTLTVGMKIDIEIVKDLNEDKRTIYPSQVLDILESDKLIIRGPIKNKKLVFLHNKDKIHISYNILNKGMHYFQGEILSREYADMYILKVKKVSPIKILQMRSYYRFSKTIDIVKQFKRGKPYEDLHIEECETKDISGGGLGIYSNYKHSIGDYVICSFLILNKQISVKCKVIRINETDSFNYKYSLGLSFLEIPEKHRDAIIEYIFNQQRKLRSKGLI